MQRDFFDVNKLAKTYFKLAVPVVLGMLVTLIYNLADTYFIARSGNLDLIAGVSMCSPLFMAFMAFGNIYGQGGSSLISRFLGKGDSEGCARVSSFCFYVAIITGLVLALVGLTLRNPILALIGANGATLPYANEYYTVLVAGAPVIVLNFIHCNFLRCEGMAKESMCGTILGACTNIVLDPIFIFTLGMGARGAALATVIGYGVNCLFFLVIVLKKSRVLSVVPSDVRGGSTGEVGDIFAIGFTAAVTNLASTFCTVMMNKLLLPYGSDRVAAMGIILKVNMAAQLILTGFAFGGVPLLGYLYGAGNKEKLKELIGFVLKFLGALALCLTVILVAFAPQFVRMFVQDAGVITEGARMLRLQAFGCVFAAVVLLMTVLFQATGKALPALLCSLSRQGVVYLVVLWIAVKIAGYNGLIATQCISDVLSTMMALCLYFAVFAKEKKA